MDMFKKKMFYGLYLHWLKCVHKIYDLFVFCLNRFLTLNCLMGILYGETMNVDQVLLGLSKYYHYFFFCDVEIVNNFMACMFYV